MKELEDFNLSIAIENDINEIFNLNECSPLTLVTLSLKWENIHFITCQVLGNYRGHKLEQKLIKFVLENINKSNYYKYAICTVSPKKIKHL